MQSLLIFGRQPALGLAELESIYGSEAIDTVLNEAVVLNTDPVDIEFNRLGGSVKLAKVLTVLPTTDFTKLVGYIKKTLPDHLPYLPEGKVKFGVSCFGIRTSVNDINRATLSIKKVIKAADRSVRVVPNTELHLNSAQVIHNQLTSPLGMELLLVNNGEETFLAQTVAEQDIASYAARDQKRPMRDAKVGMLPPKLAQIIVNLANPSKQGILLDPFCGTGVVLQEAVLMGITAWGSDLEERMVRYTRDNLNWLQETHGTSFDWHLETADATKVLIHDDVTAIGCETYLGRPFSHQPDSTTLQGVMQDVNLIHKRFLQNVASQTKAGFRLCIAVPAWRVGNDFKHLKVLDNIEELGYNRIEFVHARQEKSANDRNDNSLIYHRDGQIVARELVVLIRI